MRRLLVVAVALFLTAGAPDTGKKGESVPMGGASGQTLTKDPTGHTAWVDPYLREMLVATGYTVHAWNPVYAYATGNGEVGPGGEPPIAETSADYRGVMPIGLAIEDCNAGALCTVAIQGATVVIPQSAFATLPNPGVRVCIGNDGADTGDGGDLRDGIECNDRTLAIWGTYLGYVIAKSVGVSRTVYIFPHETSYATNRVWRSANCATFDPGNGTAFFGDLCIETDESGAYVCDTNTCEGAGWVIFGTADP